jgi:hypothetical protein
MPFAPSIVAFGCSLSAKVGRQGKSDAIHRLQGIELTGVYRHPLNDSCRRFRSKA